MTNEVKQRPYDPILNHNNPILLIKFSIVVSSSCKAELQKNSVKIRKKKVGFERIFIRWDNLDPNPTKIRKLTKFHNDVMLMRCCHSQLM